MKAIIQTKYSSPGDVLQVREIDKPVAGPGEVLVRVHATSVHPDIWHVVTSRPYILRLAWAGWLRPRNPVPGTDMVGVVESVGKGVTRFRPGDEVFGETFTEFHWHNGGAYAEYVAVPEECLAVKPANITFEQAASVPTSEFIVLSNLPQANQFRDGWEVLINGAGGGVGSLALQVCKAYGTHVTAVDSTHKLDLPRSLGANQVIDYTRGNFTQGSERYDLV